MASRSSPLLSTLVVVLASCAFSPDGEQPMSPPSLYREWWSSTEACSGKTGKFDRIQWFVVPGHGFECPGGKCAGRWQDSHTIYISDDYKNNELVVRHEMLHELLGYPGHPDPPFGAGCPLTWNSWNADRAALGDAPERPDTLHID